MRRKIKIAAIIFLTVFITLPVFIPDLYSSERAMGRYRSKPGERLLYPVTDSIDLSSKSYLEFRWSVTDLEMTDHFDFRLYKGYNTIESNLILKRDFPATANPIKLPASLFKKNQVYTWVLVQVFNDGSKGDSSSASFKVIKKEG